MSSGGTQSSGREPRKDETREANLGRGGQSAEPSLGRGGESRDSHHPAPPAEGKWAGILGQVRGLLARRRGARRRS